MRGGERLHLNMLLQRLMLRYLRLKIMILRNMLGGQGLGYLLGQLLRLGQLLGLGQLRHMLARSKTRQMKTVLLNLHLLM